jgi:hypothetical protein
MFGLPQDKLAGYYRPSLYQIYMDVVINFSTYLEKIILHIPPVGECSKFLD